MVTDNLLGRPATNTSPHDLWAAVDLGSNNFQMLLARHIRDELVFADRLKNKVQLLHGMSADRLQSDAIRRGLSVLRRYRQRLREIPSSRIRVVGTFALREAENRSAFLEPARCILGVPVEVLGGFDEARLIDLAVSRCLDGGQLQTEVGRQRLVLDVGGGSTELVWSEWRRGYRQLIEANSLPLGCVSMSDRFFSCPEILSNAYPKARAYALSKLKESRPKMDCSLQPEVIGTSGTLESILTVCEANGFSRREVTVTALAEVERAITGGLGIDGRGLLGLAPERVDIFPAGVAIVSALMESLALERIYFCGTTLADGVLYDSMGLL